MSVALAVGVPPAADAVTTEFRPDGPLDLVATIRPLQRGVGDPTIRWDASRRGLWRGVRTPAGPASLALAQRADGSVRAKAWGPGAEWAIDGVPELLGAGDDWRGLDLADAPRLAETRRRHPGLRLTRCRQVLEMLVAAILEQKVTTLEAHRSWARLVRRFGESAPGPAPEGLMVAPDADGWRRIPSWEWHRAGVTPQRADAAVRAAALGDAFERTLALGRGGPAVAARLRGVPGVGVWTAAETTQRAHGDPDSPSVGDLHLPGLVGVALTGRPVDDDGMLALLEPWRGHRHRVCRLILASGVREPRRAPRAAILDHCRR